MTDTDKASREVTDGTGAARPSSQDPGHVGSNPVQPVDPAAPTGRGNDTVRDESVKEPPSPCVSVCALDENDLCMGCYRTASEITDWFMATPAKKHDILRAAEARRKADSPIRLL